VKTLDYKALIPGNRAFNELKYPVRIVLKYDDLIYCIVFSSFTEQPFWVLRKLWRTTDALTTELTVSSLQHTGPSNIQCTFYTFLATRESVLHAHLLLASILLGQGLIKLIFNGSASSPMK
jgi:hypothetical protein